MSSSSVSKPIRHLHSLEVVAVGSIVSRELSLVVGYWLVN